MVTRSLTAKVALVTGAAKGIGAGIAKAMSAAGASLVVNFASDRSAGSAHRPYASWTRRYTGRHCFGRSVSRL